MGEEEVITFSFVDGFQPRFRPASGAACRRMRRDDFLHLVVRGPIAGLGLVAG